MTEALERIVNHWTGVHYTAEMIGPGRGNGRYVAPDTCRVIVVRDLDDGGPSVTNAAEYVVERLSATFGGLAGKRIVYRDSDGRWDELVHDGRRFVGFGSFGANTLDGALAVLRERERERRGRKHSHVDVELTTEAGAHYVVISGEDSVELERLGPYADLEHARRCYGETLDVLRELGGQVAQ
jgi:hypothetical protein